MTFDADHERGGFAFADHLDVGVRPVTKPIMSARVLAAAVLVVMVLVAMPALIGRRPATTPGYGVAGNGLIAWAIDGDIVAGDPAARTTAPLIAGPGVDRNPLFSRDGSRLAFLRQLPTDQERFDLYVSGADGSDQVMVSTMPMAMPAAVEWAPDGDSLLVNDRDGGLFRYSIHGSPPRLLVDGVQLDTGAARPPDGADLLFERAAEPGTLYVMAWDGSRRRELVGTTAGPCSCVVAGPAHWSPDGRWIAFALRLDPDESRVFVLGSDGSGLRRLTNETGPWIEDDPTWSPVGDRIAFNQWQRDAAGSWQARPIGLVAASGGPVETVGIAPAKEGALIEWSPDGRAILSLPKTLIDAYISYPNGTGSVARPVIIDVANGSSRQLDWSVGSIASWQRRAP
jgi:Tol biopolymer transport system component